ncbi:MAG: extracellular solute-binding protein [Treponema sp.]|jgi:multiple sugar transport system substrate-binding protein|nr:extracellular solute-binding protein [Treponema sp.]
MKKFLVGKKVLLVAVFFLFVSASVFAGGGSQKEGAGPVTIEMWGWNAGQMEQIFAHYKEVTGATANLNYVAVSQQETFQKLQTVVSAGLDLPDIVPSEAGQRGTMVSLDMWEDVTKAPYNFDLNSIFAYLQPLCKNEKGEMVTVPFDITSAALAYKRDLAEKYLGVSDPAAVQALFPNRDAFVAKGKEVQVASGGKVFMLYGPSAIFQIASGQNPAPIVKNNKLDLAPVKAVIDEIVRFRDNGIADNIINDTPAWSASFVDDTHIFYPCASWTPEYQIMSNDPKGPTHPWGLIVPPGGAFSWGGTGFMIPKEAKHKLEAFKFVQWLLSKDAVMWMHEKYFYNLCNVEAAKDPVLANLTNPYFGDQNLGTVFYGAADTITPRPISQYDVIIQDTFNLVTEQLNSQKNLTAGEALKIFETEFRNKAPDIQ